ncbi:MAG TPA: CHAT domain-containing protein, partial [Gemmataceae bacterium]|nr:CHAT domain-containing protein [Gemmataceae bacterium]
VLRPPKGVKYPIKVQVQVWSEELTFEKSIEELTLEAPDKESSVSFTLKDIGSTRKKQGSVFVFVKRDANLIAGFRIDVGLAPSADFPGRTGQYMDYLYLDNQWFRFEEKELAAPALTIYFRSHAGNVDVFAFNAEQPMWAELGIKAAGIYTGTKGIYLAVTELAKRIEQGEQLALSDAFELANRGYGLFSDLFCKPNTPSLKKLAKKIRNLPHGAEVTVAADLHSDEFVLPWGFLYDQTPPEGQFGGTIEKDRFWGHRFQLTIRPSSELVGSVVRFPVAETPVLGPLYELPEANEMDKYIRQLLQKRRIATSEIEIEDSWIPALAGESFDVIHFLCHGYTVLSDNLLRNALQGIADGRALKYVKEPAKGSQLFTKKGTATLAALQDKLERLQCSPIVLLSMCQSAQVSSFGGSFVTFFLNRGARAVVGTEGPNPFKLAQRMDQGIIDDLLQSTRLREAVWKMRKANIDENILALIYTVYGDGQATLPSLTLTLDRNARSLP